MKYSSILLLCISLSAPILLVAFKFLGPGETLSSSPWREVETWDDFDEDGIFELDTIECKRDNQWIFFENGKFMITEGDLKCEPDIPFLDTIRGQWALENNGHNVKLSFTGGESTMIIAGFSEEEFVFSFSGSEDPNDPVVRQRIILRR